MARNDLQGYKNAVPITYLTDLPLEELMDKLKALPEQSIVLYVWQRLRINRVNSWSPRRSLTLIAPSARSRYTACRFANVGLGIVGGYVWTMEANAAKVGELTVAGSNGARPREHPGRGRAGNTDV